MCILCRAFTLRHAGRSYLPSTGALRNPFTGTLREGLASPPAKARPNVKKIGFNILGCWGPVSP